jgi:prepilin-type N-terminal cleavage/methylation domain-containing protein
MRRGFTLVEILIAVTVGVAITATALMIFNFSNRSRSVTATARALQTALLIQERFQEDLGRLLPGASVPVKWDKAKPGRISFFAYDPAASGKDKLVMRPVVYLRDETSGLLVREWDARREAVGAAPLEFVKFAPFLSPTGPLIRVVLSVGREKGEPPGPPTRYAFLARIPTPRQHPQLDAEVGADFIEPGDEPADGTLPGL